MWREVNACSHKLNFSPGFFPNSEAREIPAADFRKNQKPWSNFRITAVFPARLSFVQKENEFPPIAAFIPDYSHRQIPGSLRELNHFDPWGRAVHKPFRRKVLLVSTRMTSHMLNKIDARGFQQLASYGGLL